jgi:hypothetical protein
MRARDNAEWPYWFPHMRQNFVAGAANEPRLSRKRYKP